MHIECCIAVESLRGTSSTVIAPCDRAVFNTYLSQYHGHVIVLSIAVSNLGGLLGAGTYFANASQYSDTYSKVVSPRFKAWGLEAFQQLLIKSLLRNGDQACMH